MYFKITIRNACIVWSESLLMIWSVVELDFHLAVLLGESVHTGACVPMDVLIFFPNQSFHYTS